MMFALLWLVAVGCAHTKVTHVYEENGESVENTSRGVPTFSPLRYEQIVVVTKGEKETKAELVTLPVYPDEPNLFFKSVAGLGSQTLGLTLGHGIATGINQVSDSNADELVAAIGAAVGGVGTAATGVGALVTSLAGLEEVQEGAGGWKGQLEALVTQAAGNATGDGKAVLEALLQDLVGWGPGEALTRHKEIGGKLASADGKLKVLCPDVSGSGSACLARQQIELANKQLASGAPTPGSSTGVSLYRVVFVEGAPTLVPLELSK